MPITKVNIIADSISEYGNRIISIECHYPRYIHAEMLRHGLLHARSVSSSRAINTNLLLNQVREDPVMPSSFGKNQPGMVAEANLGESEQELARQIWLDAAADAAWHASRLMDIGTHKQHVNRLLEPFLCVSELVTASSWNNFLGLRLANDAQPEIRLVAQLIRQAINASTPKSVEADQYHLPYLTDDVKQITQPDKWLSISVALCARLSYATYSNEKRVAESRETLGDDVWLKKQLLFANKLLEHKHLTPFEHVARPIKSGWCDQFYGWESLRHILRGDSEKR